MNLFKLINDLEAKAKAATPGKWLKVNHGNYVELPPESEIDLAGPTLMSSGDKNADKNSDHVAACSPETVLALITALREAEETLKRIENSILFGRPSYADWELRLIARDWLAKYAKGEE